jgi:hypothetical protein
MPWSSKWNAPPGAYTASLDNVLRELFPRGGVRESEPSEGGAPSEKPPKKTSRFRIMQPAPRPKPPQISPIFIADKVSLAVSREEDGKLRLG